jgi:hypothetical protein
MFFMREILAFAPVVDLVQRFSERTARDIQEVSELTVLISIESLRRVVAGRPNGPAKLPSVVEVPGRCSGSRVTKDETPELTAQLPGNQLRVLLDGILHASTKSTGSASTIGSISCESGAAPFQFMHGQSRVRVAQISAVKSTPEHPEHPALRGRI